MSPCQKHPGRGGFTLIELLAVIAVIGILAGILIPTVSAVRTSANKARTKVQFAQWAAAIESFRGEYGYYPVFHDSALVNPPGQSTEPAALHVFHDLLAGRRRNLDPLPAFVATAPLAPEAQNRKRIAFYGFSESDFTAANSPSPHLIRDAFDNTEIAVLVDRNLDGVIRIGAEVKPGDILVGKITPKSETELAPEEKLLRAIFGEKAADVKDTSLVVPSGAAGIIMDVKVSSRIDNQVEKLSPSDRRRQIKQIQEEYKTQMDKLREGLTEALSNILLGEKIPLDVINGESGEIIIPANRKITKTLLRKLAAVSKHVQIDPSPVRIKIMEIIGSYQTKFDELESDRERKVGAVEAGEGDGTGAIKQVKVYIATKQKLEVGDKMAGRHGNKGVVAKIVPEEDMPFLPDGTPVEICLNPLGVPSRMNVGQVLETHLGWACKKLGIKVATPVFDGIPEKKVREYLKDAKLPSSGKSPLLDGRTGERIDQEVVVGYIYMMKLNHLVSHKIHARAVGPYSLVTQQPLGGKAQYGGQRFGEMEVWALEAYGAAHTLQELLTVKSDDVQGRTKIYESLVKGDNTLQAGTPESFNVLIKEIQSLGLDIKLNKRDALGFGS